MDRCSREDSMTTRVQTSVIVPLFNEAQTVGALVEAVRAAMSQGPEWELILVDDGSGDDTAVAAAQACARYPDHVRLVRLARNYGQTAALQAGFDEAGGAIVVSMDGDLQNDPADVPALLAKLDEGYDLVVGYRVRRRDRLLTRRIPSWIANRIIQRITGVRIRDNGCSLKAYRRELLERVRLYSDMHRFIPAIAAGAAGARIAEIPVRHHPRRFGTSKYGLSRIGAVLADLLVVTMVRSFRDRPLALFSVGALLALAAAAVFGAAGTVSILAMRRGEGVTLVFPAAALMFVGLSVYLLFLGLIAELAVREQLSRPGIRGPLLHGEIG